MSATETELKKEFELERMILFSDAVFAIAITLLIIEIKFPEVPRGASSSEIFNAFKPVMVRFAGFILTFFFTGLMWSRHLSIFKYLRTYDNGVILRNLVMLFFIVCFPFSASGITEHIRPGFFLPLHIYIVNTACVALSNFILCNYIFKTKEEKLTIPGFKAEKKYLLLQSKYSALTLVSTAAAVMVISYFNSRFTFAGFYLAPIMIFITRKHLKKYKPAKAGNTLNPTEAVTT